MATAIPLNKANTNSNSTSNVKERQLKFRKVKSGKFRLYFQIKGNENYDTVCLDEDKKPVTKSKSSYKELLKQKKYPLDLGSTDYWVPIAIGESKKVNKTLNSADIKLTPVFPLSFSEEKGTRLAHLRSGYLYIFMDGFLWREIQVNKKDPKSGKFIDDWKFYDVNLTLHQGKDERKAIDGVSSRLGAIVIPYKIGKKNPKIEVCFSHVQWSWDYICKMGGMDKDNDPRYIKALQSKYNNVKPVDAIKQSRLQLIKLHEYNITKKSPDDIRSKYLMPLKQAYKENKKPTLKNIIEKFFIKLSKLSKLSSVVDAIVNSPLHTYFAPDRAYLGHLHPSEKISKRTNQPRDIYIKSDLPALILIDPVDVADNLRLRFVNCYAELIKYETETQTEYVTGLYVVNLLKSDKTLQEHLKGKKSKETVQARLNEIKKIKDGYNDIAIVLMSTLKDFIGKHKLSQNKVIKNSFAAALKDYEVMEAYKEKRKRKKACEALALWDRYTTFMNLFKSGAMFLADEGSSQDTTTALMLAVVFNADVLKAVNKEGENIKPMFRCKNVQLITKIPKQDPHKGDTPWSKQAQDWIGTTEKFLLVSGSLLQKVFRRYSQIFIKSGAFPWHKFDKMLEKVWALNLQVRNYTLDQFKQLMQDSPEFTPTSPEQLKQWKAKAKKLKLKIKIVDDQNREYGTSVRGVMVRYSGGPSHLYINMARGMHWVISHRYLGHIMLGFGVFSTAVTLYDLSTTKSEKDRYYFMKWAETTLTVYKLYGQMYTAIMTVPDHLLLDMIDAGHKIMSGKNKGKVMENKSTKAKPLRLPNSQQPPDAPKNAVLHTPEGKNAQRIMTNIATFAKLGSIAGNITDVFAIIRLHHEIEKTNVDGREFKKAILQTDLDFLYVGAVGGLILTFEVWFSVAAISLGLTIVGWILIIVAAIYLIWKAIAGPEPELTAVQHWIRRCYWGEKAYSKTQLRVKKKDLIRTSKNNIKDKDLIYINYSDMEDNLKVELYEINQLLNNFYVKVYWSYNSDYRNNNWSGDRYLYDYSTDGGDLRITPRNKDHKPYCHYRVSLVIDIVVPGWNEEKKSHIGIEAIGIPSTYMKSNPVNNPFYNKRTIDKTMKIISSKRVDEKIEIFSKLGKGLVRTDFDYLPKEPHYVNPKQEKDEIIKMKTIRYRLDEMEVNPYLFEKIDISIMYYPQITDAIVYPNPDGVIVNMLAEPARQGFRGGGDGVIRGIRTVYVSQKQNPYKGKPK